MMDRLPTSARSRQNAADETELDELDMAWTLLQADIQAV